MTERYISKTRGVPSMGSTNYGPRGQEQNFHSASGVRRETDGTPCGQKNRGFVTACTPMDRYTAGVRAKGGRRMDGEFSGFDGSNRMFVDNDGGPTDLWFNQSGSNTITVGGDKYSFEPVLSWNPGCDTMDQGGDGIFPNANCESKPGVGGVPGLGVSALRWKNGVMY